MQDLFGQAILDFATYGNAEDIITETSISEADPLPVSYLFRSFDEMPEMEQRALSMASGKILDVGCGAGSHSLWLKSKGKNVVSVDISRKAIDACEMRGLTNAYCTDVMTFEGKDFDTILLLMNGTGICGTLDRLQPMLEKLKSMLSVDGQILIDSSDLSYMYDEDDLPEDRYYGEVDYTVRYKGMEETSGWLYTDFSTLSDCAVKAGLTTELVMNGPNFDYLTRLTKMAP